MTGRWSKSLCLAVLYQAPQLDDGHLDRAILSLFCNVLADRDLFRPDLMIGLRVVN
jgi:hypothetical protein